MRARDDVMRGGKETERMRREEEKGERTSGGDGFFAYRGRSCLEGTTILSGILGGSVRARLTILTRHLAEMYLNR